MKLPTIGLLGQILASVLLTANVNLVQAGAQRYEPLAASVRAALHAAISDRPVKNHGFASTGDGVVWLAEHSRRLARYIPDARDRVDFLNTVHYEATRAGLDPQLVLAVIDIESKFRKYAVSRAGARGYMQVMPFWITQIGRPQDNLFHLRTSLRYGCTILRFYLNVERGDLFRALGRYNGSLGEAEYPQLVQSAWNGRWNSNSATQRPTSLKTMY